jgi:acyl transferase domain-containing protein
VPVWSNGAAAPHGPAPLGALAEQLAGPVRFVEMIEGMYQSGARTFVEIGPGSVLTGLVGRILGDRPHLAVELDRKGKNSLLSALLGLGRLWAAGHALDLSALAEGFAAPAPALAPVKGAVAISGANVGNPYPPKGGAAARPKPNPPRTPQVVEKIVEKVVEKIVERPVLAASSPVAAPAPASDWVSALQESQRQTAEAHAAFQRAMMEATQAAMEQQREMMRGMSGGAEGVLPPAVPVPVK